MEYKLVKSKRKTIQISINKNLEVIVRAPNRITKKDADTIVSKNADWIIKHLKVMKQRVELNSERELSEEEIQILKSNAKEKIPQKVEFYSKIMDVSPTKVKITGAKTRWGSCSGKNSVCFSYRIMMLPEDIIDYIVVHELAHIRHKNHGPNFYKEIELYMPDFKLREKKLKEIQKNFF